MRSGWISTTLRLGIIWRHASSRRILSPRDYSTRFCIFSAIDRYYDHEITTLCHGLHFVQTHRPGSIHCLCLALVFARLLLEIDTISHSGCTWRIIGPASCARNGHEPYAMRSLRRVLRCLACFYRVFGRTRAPYCLIGGLLSPMGQLSSCCRSWCCKTMLVSLNAQGEGMLFTNNGACKRMCVHRYLPAVTTNSRCAV